MVFEASQNENWSAVIGTVATGIIGLATLLITEWIKRRKAKAELETTKIPTIDDIEDERIRAAFRHLEKKIATLTRVLDTIFNAQGDAFWRSDHNGKCVFASDELARLIGLDKQDILGDGWVTNLKEEDKERVFRAWDQAVQQKRGFIMRYSFVHSDDTEVKISANAQPIVVDGQLEGYIGVLKEIQVK